VINDRAIVRDRGQAGFGGRSRDQRANAPKNERTPYQEFYPRGQFIWPRKRTRLLWTWAFRWRNRRDQKRPALVPDKEWDGAMHLPAMFRTGGRTHIFTRNVVPVNENLNRQVYFHAYKVNSWIGNLYQRIVFAVYHDWSENMNFSGQDGRQMIYQYYDKPEKLSVSDAYTIAWRKLVTENARELPRPTMEGVPLSEEYAEYEEIPGTQEALAQTGGAGGA
jgi:hypothetical protein